MGKVLVVGSSVVDLTFYTARIPAVGETVSGRFAQGLGGKGFNQAVASARSGTQTRFISALGNDAFQESFKNKLKELGIESALETIPGAATGAAAISVDRQGRNNIIVALGANDLMSPAFLEKNRSFFQGIGVLLLQFETNLEVIETALKMARRESPHALTILNPAPALPEIPSSILGDVDLLTPNETELEVISGRKIRSEEELQEACAAVPVHGAILATLGEKGSYYYKKQSGDIIARRHPAFTVEAVDTTGAGDAFNGGLAGALAQTGELPGAIRFASALAAISVTRPGTSASMPTRSEIIEFLSSRNDGAGAHA